MNNEGNWSEDTNRLPQHVSKDLSIDMQIPPCAPSESYQLDSRLSSIKEGVESQQISHGQADVLRPFLLSLHPNTPVFVVGQNSGYWSTITGKRRVCFTDSPSPTETSSCLIVAHSNPQTVNDTMCLRAEKIAILAPILSMPSLLERRDISWVTSPRLGDKVWILKGFSLPWAVVGVTRRMRYFDPSRDMKQLTLEETVNMMSIRSAVILPEDEETARGKSIESHLVRLLSTFKRYPTKKNFNEVLQYTLPGYPMETRLSASRGVSQACKVFLSEDDEDDEDDNRVGHREWNVFKESFTKIKNEGGSDWQTIWDFIRDTDTNWAVSRRPLGNDEMDSLITSVCQSQSSAATRARCLRI